MFCKKCGNQLNPGASFCNKCGTPVENSTQPQVNNYQPNMQQNLYQNTQGYQQPNMYQNQQQNMNQNFQANVQQNNYNPNYNYANANTNTTTNTNTATNKGQIVTEADFQKRLNSLKTYCIIVCVLNGLSFLRNLGELNFLAILTSIAEVVFVICFYVFSKQKSTTGPIMGFICSGLYFLMAILGLVASIFYILVEGLSGIMGFFSVFLEVLLGIAILKDAMHMYKYIKSTDGNQ